MLSIGWGYFSIGTVLETIFASAGDVERVKKLFLDSGHDIKNVKFLEAKAGGS